MLRIILIDIILFLLPFLVYGFWLWVNNKAHVSEHWRKGPMAWLALAGIALVVVSFVIFASIKQAPDGAEYRPAHMENGVFVPGHYE
jgi:cytochrome bd-type quinol oxidase subunit 2